MKEFHGDPSVQFQATGDAFFYCRAPEDPERIHHHPSAEEHVTYGLSKDTALPHGERACRGVRFGHGPMLFTARTGSGLARNPGTDAGEGWFMP